MEPLSHEERIQCQFDSFCKKTLKLSAREYYRKIKRRAARETNISELSTQDIPALSITDEYYSDNQNFVVSGFDVTVSDSALAEALNELPADRLKIVLLSYFLGMTDGEIAEQLNLVRRTVAYRRAMALQKLKIILEENNDE